MKVALVYDRVNKWGGAERVLLALREIFPEAPLYTSVYNPKTASWAKAFPSVRTSFLQNIPFAKAKHEYLALLMPHAFESFNFDGFDLVISVTSEAAKGIITSPHTKHICYCLTPTRYLWSAHDLYFDKSLVRTLSQPIVNYLRFWDKRAAARPDTMLAISNEVKKRIKTYYNRSADIVYPPTHEHWKIPSGKPKEDYYLLVSRLVPYKKVDLAIEAFKRLKRPLVIVGTGSEGKRLKRLSSPNIKFVGQLTDEKLGVYYNNCKALIFPQEEDFGLVALEAQSFGKPVIAFEKGGALDTVIRGKTGVFFKDQSPQSLVNAVRDFEKMKFDSRIIKANAKKFSKEKFKKEFLKAIGRW